MRVLVVVPTHDRLEFLDEALASLATQTRQADEIVVVGNVMSPNPHSVAYIASDESFATRMNSIIEASECDAFILLSDDDLLLPTYIERTAAKMEETNADVVYTEFGMIPVTALIRKSIWAKVGGYCDIGFFDWDLNWSMLEAGAKAVPVREHLFFYRQHPAQVAQHAKWHEDGTWAMWKAAIEAKHPKCGRP
jgi:Glycosyl transferase family 2